MESLQRAFRVLGLTGFDAKVYTTLLLYGPLSPSQLAERLEVHRPQVYAALRRLEDKGLIEVSRGKPPLYRAVDPKLFLSKLEEEIRGLRESVLGFLQSMSASSTTPRHGVWSFSGLVGPYDRFKWAIEGSKIDLALRGDATFLKEVFDSLLNALGRGVLVYALVHDPLENEVLRYVSKLPRVRTAVSGHLLVIADSKVAVLLERRGDKGLAERGFVIEEPVLINYLLHDFCNVWSRSKIIRNEPLKLPARFTVLRLALEEAKALLDKGTRLRGVFVGRSPKGGRRVVQGTILDLLSDPASGIFRFMVEDRGELVTIGGSDAALEDLAAEEITLSSA